MPMVNPDGVDLVTGNFAVSSPNYQKALHIANQFSSIPFPLRLESKYKWCELFLFPSLKILLLFDISIFYSF